MLEFMREKASSWIIKGLLILVALSFVVWGGFSGSNKKDTNVAARVDGNIISSREYRDAYNNLLQLYRNIYKGNLPANLRDSIGKNAIEQLIQSRLLSKEIDKEKFVVSDDEIIERIENNPNLKKDGRFDWNDYLQIPAERRHEYENALKREILFKKLEDVIKDGVKVSPVEIRDAYLKENEQVKVEYIMSSPSTFKDKAEITEQGLKEYYDKNKDSYKTSKKIKVEYAAARAKDFENEVQIDDDAIKDYYNEHIDRYYEDDKVRASHILIKAAKGDKEAEQKAKEKAEKILKEVKEVGDFAELAKKYSEDSTAAKGGDLGYFSKGRMVKEFEDAAFSLKKDEVSDIVKTDFGYHIIKVTDVRHSRTKPLGEVKSIIEASIKKRESARLARQQVKRLYRGLEKDFKGDMKKGADKFSITFNTTDFFARGDRIPGIYDTSQFIEEAFSLKKGETGRVIKGKDVYYILKLVDIKEAYIPEMDEVRKEAEEDFKNEESKRLAENKLEELLKRFNEGTSFSKIAEELNDKVKTPDFFKRTDPVPEVGRDEEFIKAAFDLGVGNARIIKSGQRYYLIKVVDRKGIDDKKFAEEEKKFIDKILKQKQNRVYMAWLDSLRKKADVWINEQFL